MGYCLFCLLRWSFGLSVWADSLVVCFWVVVELVFRRVSGRFAPGFWDLRWAG